MRIGIILHGPEIIDVGSAKRIIDIFNKEHEVVAKLGGTMGRTAVLDAGLEDVIDISQGFTPSETIIFLTEKIDLAVLLNHGKTLGTGINFGQIISSKLIGHPDLPFIHIERPDDNGRILYYSPNEKRCAEYVRKVLAAQEKKYDLKIEKVVPLPSNIRIEGGIIIRRISGAFPGENIRLEGIVIGEVVLPGPEIVCRDGKILELRGGKIKPHGLEKLEKRRIDLFTAKIKTGNIRRSIHKPRIKDIVRGGTVAIIDHCAESTFELIKGAGLVITVGDDTTAIAADILTRLGIPVIGITDGDLDNVLANSVVPAGSIILRVKPGFDDIVGLEVFEKLMHNRKQINAWNIDEFSSKVIALAEKYIVDIKKY